MPPVPHLAGLRDIADRYDYFLLDIYGLLHNGVALNPGTLGCFDQLRKHGKKICLVSNTPRRAENAASDQLRHGIDRSCFDHVVTAGESARIKLQAKYKNKKVYFLGNEYFAGTMENLGILQVRDIHQADFILNAIPGTFEINDAQLIALLHEARNLGLPMVCANPDLVVHIGETLYTCAGTYAAFYEQIGGAVSWHGKPYAAIYDLAFDLIGRPSKDKVCAIGDALRTDIRGACDYGIDGIWALTGIHWEELRYDRDPGRPDPVRVEKAISESAFKPTATIRDFSW